MFKVTPFGILTKTRFSIIYIKLSMASIKIRPVLLKRANKTLQNAIFIYFFLNSIWRQLYLEKQEKHAVFCSKFYGIQPIYQVWQLKYLILLQKRIFISELMNRPLYFFANRILSIETYLTKYNELIYQRSHFKINTVV